LRSLELSEIFDSIRLPKGQPDSTSGKTFASGARGMGFKPRADQIFHTFTATTGLFLVWFGLYI